MAVTESSATDTTEGTGAPARLFGPRGRHRRPRPRKVLLAAGGLALAAGALSLVRLTPESGLGGLGTPEAEPWLDPSGDSTPTTDRATNAAATVGKAAPQVSPSATTVMGGLSATPTAAPPSLAATTAPASPQDPATTIPEAPNTTAPQPRPTPPATTPPAQPPAAAPSGPPTTPAPQPSPSPSDRPGVCVPIIGLCVDPLTKHND